MNLKIAALIGSIVWFSSMSAAAAVQAQISQQGDVIHFEMEGLSQWDYDLKKIEKNGKTFVELTVPPFSETSARQVQSFSHPMVQKIDFNPKGPDGKVILTFQMKSGGFEAFDYLTERPSRLIVDFFKGTAVPVEKKTASENEKPAPKAAPLSVKLKPKAPAAAPQEADSQRKPATADVLVVNEQGQTVSLEQALQSPKADIAGLYDGGDPNFERFSVKDYEVKEESIIASQEKVYLDFPMMRIQSPYLDILQTRKPIYQITPQEGDENLQARLLLTLFENKRYNVFLKTVDWFFSKYPQSQYDEMIRFMWADAHFAIWNESQRIEDFDLAMLRYRQALEKYPQSPLMERTMMLMGFATLDRGDYLGTLRLFQTHLQKRPSSPNKDISRFAIADAYLKINRYDEVNQIYNEIEKDAFQEKDKVQAAFLRGDVAYQKKDYRSAIQEYQNALKKYPYASVEYPNALYNQAAAYFGMKEYRKSLELYREFLKKFPTRTETAYAMTRVGELLDILGADKSRVLGTYLETYFRFGESPTAVVARLRMLSERMHTMKAKEVEKALKDIQQLAKSSDLPKMDQFATLLISEGFNSRKEYDKAVNLLIRFYQDNPTTADSKLVANRIVQNINDELYDLVQNGQFINALKLHNKYADNWLKSSDRVDTKYNIAKAYEQAGVFKQAQSLYQDTLNQIYSLKGTAAGRARNVLERMPGEDEANLRLAAVQFNQNQFGASYDSLKNIKNPEKMSERDQIERVSLAADLLDRRGETDSAIRYLTELLKEWSGVPELVAEPYLKLAQLELKRDKPDEAIASLLKINTLLDDSGKVSPATHSKSLELLGETYLKKGEKALAMSTFEKLLNAYEKNRPLSSYRYRVGQMYFEQGEIKKAEEVWNELKNEKNDFWYKLAREQLKGSEWKDDYKKYIKRIPAMSKETPATERK